MTTTSSIAPPESEIHGLTYPDTFLSALPVIHPRPLPHAPIRSISASQFADIHLKYLTSHAPDHVIFPFLHGLEGDNEAQNMFFAPSSRGGHSPEGLKNEEDTTGCVGPTGVKVPQFRGLLWVACDDEQDGSHANRSGEHIHNTTSPTSSEEDQLISSDYDEDYSYSSSSEDDDEVLEDTFSPMPMDIDLDLDVDVDDMHTGMDLDPVHSQDGVVSLTDHGEGKHMHPVHQRGNIAAQDMLPHDRRPSQASTVSTDSSNISSYTTDSTAATSVSSCGTSPSPSSKPSLSVDTQTNAGPVGTQILPCYISPESSTSSSSSQVHVQQPRDLNAPPPPLPPTSFSPSPSPLPTPPFLTSSFREKELLREVRELREVEGEIQYVGSVNGRGDIEFVEPKVPEGISLRNFGIQTPIFATLSDVVVYSPRGNVRAAIALAEKFKQAIESKYASRIERVRQHNPHLAESSPHPELGLGPEHSYLVKYNVFVLDASVEDIHRHLSHLVARVEDVSVPHAYTDGTDAHTHARNDDSEVELVDSATGAVPTSAGGARTPLDIMERGEGSAASPPAMKKVLRANTINFAQREKDEMRDLTQASEILSVLPPNYRPLSSDPGIEGEDLISGSSTASYWDPNVGQVFLGNSTDVPLPPEDPQFARRHWRKPKSSVSAPRHPDLSSMDLEEGELPEDAMDEDQFEEAFDWRTNDPSYGLGYDICIECDDLAPFPNSMHMRAAEEHVRRLEKLWVERCLKKYQRNHPHGGDSEATIPPRPPPHANSVMHLPFPSSVAYATSLLPFISWLEMLLQPVSQPLTYEGVRDRFAPPPPPPSGGASGRNLRRGSSTSVATSGSPFQPSSLPPPSSFPQSFLPPTGSIVPVGASYTRARSTSATYSHSSSPGRSSNQSHPTVPSQGHIRHTPTPPPAPLRTRPLKVLIYSADGYTESSSLALCILMALKELNLPEAYLELQVEKKRSFFVYPQEVQWLRRIESRLERERNVVNHGVPPQHPASRGIGSLGGRIGHGRPASQSISYPAFHTVGESGTGFLVNPTNASSGGRDVLSSSEGSTSSSYPGPGATMMLGKPTPPMKRPRASTLPALPSFHDHSSWFNDHRFDGSFPSRVLPFLYLGNLNHATNAYMLHALGITHVVSVGECALLPPPSHNVHASNAHCGPGSNVPNNNCTFIPGKGPQNQGSLFIEEREGRIKVLDIKGICDDGIDTLEPQLAPICQWIDKAREEGGKVLVHCRVGVSRSATVTIAYVMKHLGLSLVDAYLIVRSRRLSVLIQPNMRLLYNLMGWEVRLAKGRAGIDLDKDGEEELDEEKKERLRRELERCLNWPYLAREVHKLNEKYLH
ncbi:hypothetical protein ABKN59_009635 [Abortiporus biennis]